MAMSTTLTLSVVFAFASGWYGAYLIQAPLPCIGSNSVSSASAGQRQQYKSFAPSSSSSQNMPLVASSPSGESQRPVPWRQMNVKDETWDMVVLGAGPAGLTAALYGARAGLSVLILGSAKGQLAEATSLENYPAGPAAWDLLNNANAEATKDPWQGAGELWLIVARAQAAKHGVKFAPPGTLATTVQLGRQHSSGAGGGAADGQPGTVAIATTVGMEGRTATPKGDGTRETPAPILARALIVATGATPRMLDPSTDPTGGTLWGQYLHSCVLCDGALYGSASVVVVGGGDAAVDAALQLLRIASAVTLVHRRETFRSTNAAGLQRLRSDPRATILTSYIVKHWLVEEEEGGAHDGGGGGTTGGSSSRMQLRGAALVSSLGGSKAPVELACRGGFVLIGAVPNTGFLDGAVDLDGDGYIRLPFGRRQSSSDPRVYAAGEVADAGYRQAVTAAADGAKAAIDAERWLRDHSITRPSSSSSSVARSVTAAAAAAAAAKEGDGNGKGVGEIKSKIHSKGAEFLDEKVAVRGTDAASSSRPVISAPGAVAAAATTAECTEKERLGSIACIKATVAAHPVVVFSKQGCPYCRAALEALANEGVTSPLVIDLTGPSGPAVQALLKSFTGRRTVPNVFVGGKSIGGGDETVALHRNGELFNLLRDANRGNT